MFFRRAFVLTATALSYLASVETPEVSGVATIVLPCTPSLHVCVDPRHEPWSGNPANASGDDKPFQMLDELGWFTAYPPPRVVPVARSPSPLAKVVRVLNRLLDFDFDTISFVFGITYELAQRHRFKAGLTWWISLFVGLKTMLMLGGMSAALALGLCESKESLGFTDALDIALWQAVDWLMPFAYKARPEHFFVDQRANRRSVPALHLVLPQPRSLSRSSRLDYGVSPLSSILRVLTQLPVHPTPLRPHSLRPHPHLPPPHRLYQRRPRHGVLHLLRHPPFGVPTSREDGRCVVVLSSERLQDMFGDGRVRT